MTSIQKVLQSRKKNPSELEAEQFEKNQYSHITKALNSYEGAPKEKHIRAIILGTFHYAGASIFFKHSNMHNLQSNPISCWKYLYAIHKIMRDGHETALKDVIRNERYIKELNDQWRHLKSGYGTIISGFCKVLMQKIKFHKKYREIPGNLVQTNDDSLIVGRSNDSIFELSLDIMDYLDVFVNFEQAVVNSLDKTKANSMIPQGQCKLTPLIQVIQDMATLYDIAIRLLFKLHSKIDIELLSGHRQRFLTLFHSIKSFFKLAQTFQYFKTLIQVPTLPENPPNFLIESDLVAQKALVVNVNEDLDNNLESPEKPDALIDFDKMDSSNKFDEIFGEMDAFNFSENDRQQMQNEIDYLKALIEKIKAEYSEKVNSLLARIRVLEEEVKGLVQLKDQYEEKIREYENHKCDAINAEKFNKIKDAYSKLREEHVKVLRKQGDSLKELEESKQEINKLQKKIEDQAESYAILEKEVLLNSSNSKSIDECQQELADVQSKLKVCERTKYEQLAKYKNLETKHKDLTNELSRLQSDMDKLKESEFSRINQLESELSQLQFQLNQANSDKQLSSSKLQHLQDQLTGELNNKAKLVYLNDNLMKQCCLSSQQLIANTYNSLNNGTLDNCKADTDYIKSLIDSSINEIGLINEMLTGMESPDVRMSLFNSINKFGHYISDCLVHNKILSNDADHFQPKLIDLLGAMFNQSTELLSSIASDSNNLHWSTELLDTLNSLLQTSEQLRQHQISVSQESNEDEFDRELRNTRNAIDLAEQRFKMILEESRSKLTGTKLEVNEKILDSCTDLMYAIKVLIDRSKTMQGEIIVDGKGSGSVKDFYKKHHKWTEGLISAAKSVGAGATWLCESADNLLTKDGKFEELIVCAREITASTTQLVVSSRVKANPTSLNLTNLIVASKGVSSATGKVIANAKNAVSVLEEKGSYDFTKLSLTQARKLEMESQVRVLELEKNLDNERQRLGEIRNYHYQLAGEMEDNEYISVIQGLDELQSGVL